MITTYTSSERPVELPPAGYPMCCGMIPIVLHYPRNELTNICCRNPACRNHEDRGGVLANDVDADAKWERCRFQEETPPQNFVARSTQ